MDRIHRNPFILYERTQCKQTTRKFCSNISRSTKRNGTVINKQCMRRRQKQFFRWKNDERRTYISFYIESNIALYWWVCVSNRSVFGVLNSYCVAHCKANKFCSLSESEKYIW